MPEKIEKETDEKSEDIAEPEEPKEDPEPGYWQEVNICDTAQIYADEHTSTVVGEIDGVE